MDIIKIKEIVAHFLKVNIEEIQKKYGPNYNPYW